MDRPPSGAALDLDADLLAVRAAGEEVETRPVGESLGLGERRLGYIAHFPTAPPLPLDRVPHGDLLHGRVVLLFLLLVVRGNDQRVEEQRGAAGDDPARPGFEVGQGAAFLPGQPALLGADFLPLLLFGGALPAGSEFRAAGGEFGGLQVEADRQPTAALREFAPRLGPALLHEVVPDALRERRRLRPHGDAAGGQRDTAGRDLRRGAQQHQPLDGLRGRGGAGGVADAEQAALDDLRFVVGPRGEEAGVFLVLDRRGAALHGDERQVEEVRLLRPGVHEDGAAPGVPPVAPSDFVGERVEDPLAGVEPDAGLAGFRRRAPHREAGAGGRRVGFQRGQQRVEGAGPGGSEREEPVRVAADFQVEQRGRLFHEPPHIRRQQFEVALAVEVGAEFREPFGDFAGLAVDPLLLLGDFGHAVGGQLPGEEAFGGLRIAVAGEAAEHHFAERAALEQAADDIEHLVAGEFVADGVQFLQQDFQDAAFVGVAGDQVGDADFAALAIAVDAAHPLFQPRRVPGDVVVGHPRAELEVDALPGGVGGDQVAGALRVAEVRDLLLALAPGEAAVDQRHPADEAESFQAAHQVVGGVPVFGEEEPFAAAGLVVFLVRRFEHLAQAVELGLGAGVQQPAGAVAEVFEGGDLLLQALHGEFDEGTEHGVLVTLVALVDAVRAGVLVGGAGLEPVLAVAGVQLPLGGAERLRVRPPGLQVGGGFAEFPDAALERAEDRPGGTGEPPLEDAHRQLRRRAVGEGAAVGGPEVVGGEAVEGFFAVGAVGQAVGDGVAAAGAVERLAGEGDHLLLRPADEVAVAEGGASAAAGLAGGERVGVEEPPEEVVGRVLAHVRRRGEQQQVPGAPAEAGEVPFPGGGPDAGQRFGQPVAAGGGDPAGVDPGAQFVRLVEDHEVVGADGLGAERLEGGLAGEGVQRDDGQVAARVVERAALAEVRPGDDAEAEAEEFPQFALPVADEAGGRDDERPGEPPPGQHLPEVEAGHDRLPGPGVVGEQEAEGVLGQHPLVHGDPLVREGVDPGGFGGERRVELVPVGQPQRLRHRRRGLRIPGEVQRRRVGRAGDGLLDPPGFQGRRVLFEPLQPLPRRPLRPRLPGLPPMDRERRHPQRLRELLLGQPQPPPHPAHFVAYGVEVHARPPLVIAGSS